MTAKEKAQELKYKFLFERTESISNQGARLFASFVVDEIIKTYPQINDISLYGAFDKDLNFWKEVKEEIEKL